MSLNDEQMKTPISCKLNGAKRASFLYGCLFALVILINVNPIKSQYRPKWPSPILQREIFVLNLEDGYFACQVNESTDFLQLFELSKLCDGKPNCFKGSDELTAELKCSDRNQCHPKQNRCTNGACLDNLCYCNDGYGGKGCDLPDENECKYRPCDVFAHCTNTLGSFYCSCLPGYDGDGFSCHDINECEDPTLSSFCVENAECCNLPGHFVCKCQEGYQGNGTQKCEDIDECLNPDSCGRGAICANKIGFFECSCPQGFSGDPLKECWDTDECKSNPCGNGTCQNLPGDFSCACLPGYAPKSNQKPEDGCYDVNECEAKQSPCGTNALCTNLDGGYFCSCPAGHTGDPRTGCVDIDECSLNSCGANTICINSIGNFACQCKPNFSGDPYLSAGCSSINSCDSNPCGSGAICVNQESGYECKCPNNFRPRGSPEFGCDKAECDTDENCVGNARCLNGAFCYCPRPYVGDNCTCPIGYLNDPYAGCLSREETRISYAECTDKVVCPAGTVCYRGLCSRKDSCQTDDGCQNDSACKLVNEEVGKQCVEPCDFTMCGPNSFCETQNHQPFCKCNTSYSGDPNNLLFGCSPSSPKGAPPDACDQTSCGPNSFCRSNGQTAECHCANKHFTGNPYDLKEGCTLSASAHLCANDEDCSIEKSCILTLEGVRQCVDICQHHQCSEGSKCVVRNHRALCECLFGLARVSYTHPNGSITGTCEPHLCESDIECKVDEHCIVNQRGLLDCVPVCSEMQCGENAECIPIAHQASCRCKPNFEGNAMDLIKGCQPTSYPCEGCKREPRGCISPSDCGDAQDCVEGQCRFLCYKDSECIVGERCLDGFCVPIGTRITINMPHREPYGEGDAEKDKDGENKYVTPSTPSTSSDQKIVQPNLEPSTFPHLKTDTGLPATHRKPPIQPGQPSVLEDDNFNPPKIDINRQPQIGERPVERRPTERPSIDRTPFDRKPGVPEFDRPDLSRPDLSRPDLSSRPESRPDLSRPDLSRPDFGRPDLSRPDLSRPDLSRPDLSRPESRPDLSRPDLSRPDFGRPDLSRPDLSRPDLSRPESRPDLSRPDLSRPDSSRPESRPDLSRPDLSRPDLSRPDLGRPESRPDLSRPDIDDHKMITRPVGTVQPPKVENNVNIGQPDIRHPSTGPDATEPIIEEPHKEDRPVDDMGRIKPQPGFGDRQPDYTGPSSEGKQPTGDGKYLPTEGKQPAGLPAVDHHGDDIYNPPEYPEYKPKQTDTGVRDDGIHKIKPTQPKQPSTGQMMPEYKHPLTPTGDYGDRYPPTGSHKKQPTINDRKPLPIDFESELPVDDRRPARPNGTTADEYPDTRYPDSRHPDSRHPDSRHPDSRYPDSRYPDNKQSSARPDLLHPHIKTDTPFIENRQPPFKDDKKPARPDTAYPDNKPYVQPSTTRPKSPIQGDYIHPTKPTPDKHVPAEGKEPMDEYNPPDYPSSSVKPADDKFTRKPIDRPGVRPVQPVQPIQPVQPVRPVQPVQPVQPDLPFKEVTRERPTPLPVDHSKPPQIKTDSQRPTQPSLRPELKWPTRTEPKPVRPSEDHQPQPPVYTEPESRQPVTTPESIRMDLDPNKPPRTDIRTEHKPSIKPDQQPPTRYPVSTKPDITRPETYTRQPVDSYTQATPVRQPTSRPDLPKERTPQTSRPDLPKERTPQTSKPHHIGGYKDNKDETAYTKPTSGRPYEPVHRQETPTTKPFIDRNKQSTSKPAQPNTFTEVKAPVDTEIRQPGRDKNKIPPALDHSRPESKEPYEDTAYPSTNNYSKPSTSFTSRPNVTPPSSRQPVTVRPQDTRKPPEKETSGKPAYTPVTRKPETESSRPSIKEETTKPHRPSFNYTATSRPEIRKTTSMPTDQNTRTTEVKHSSMQDFTSRPSIKTQPSSHRPTDYRPSSQSTSPPFKHRPELNTPSSVSKETTGAGQTSTTPIGEKCVNNYCVPFFDEGMLQIPVNKSQPGSTSQPTYGGGRPIATITTTEESVHRPSHVNDSQFKPIHKPTDMHPTIDHPTEIHPGTIGIQICEHGVCRDKVTSCFEDNDCPSDKTCDLDSKQCISPCFICGANSECSAVDHRAVCVCPKGTVGEASDKELGCYPPPETTDPSTERTIPPVSHINVLCQSDGVQTGVKLGGYDGIIYVKGYSQEYECRRSVRSDERDVIDFKVMFGQCGLFHANGEASFILVVQKHPKLVTYRARAYHIKCMYNTGERVVTLGFNVSMITTSGTIANTGPPPTCSLSICTLDGNEVSSAEIGDDLLLKVNVQPDYIYGGFARSCIAKTMEEEGEFQYEVTDANGCATDPSIFGNWEFDENKKSLVARFNAFKFPSSNNLRFQCNIRICFNNCPTASCEESEAYGRRRRRRELEEKDDDQSLTLTSSLGIETYKEGQLREEIQVQSNAILTFEKREQSSEPFGQQRSEEELDHVCLPKLGLVLSMIVTTLLAIVAVASVISCWLMAYRRKVNYIHQPLDHPSEIPNPLFSSPTPTNLPAIPEPIPDYYNH